MDLDIRLQYGPILLGICFNLMLFGISLAQTFHYYMMYKKDKIWIKLLVFYLLIVESANAACVIYIIYQPLIERFGLLEAVIFFPTMLPAEPLTVVAISTPIQLFFAWRVWLITKSKFLPALIAAFASLSLAGGLWTGYRIIRIQLYERAPELRIPALVMLLSSCAADVLITAILVFSLHKKKTGFVATDDVIGKIIRMTVQTNLLTTICALGDVSLFLSLPHTGMNFVLAFWLPRLYSNSLLSSLNARASLQLSTRSTDYHSTPRHITAVSTRRTDGSIALESMSPKRYSQHAGEHYIGAYDLESDKTLDHSPDVEFGITITKVVETKEDTLTPEKHTQ